MSRLGDRAEQLAYERGQREALHAAEAAEVQEAGRRTDTLLDDNLHHVDHLRQQGDALGIHVVVHEIDAEMRQLGTVATRSGVILEVPALRFDGNVTWMPHGPAMPSWQAAHDAMHMPAETRALRAYRLDVYDRRLTTLPGALVLLYQRAGEFSSDPLRLAVTQPSLHLGSASFEEVLFERRIDQRAALLRQALELDEVLADYVQARSISHTSPKLTEAQIEHITFMYYAARLLDSSHILGHPWSESTAIEHLVDKNYERLAGQLGVHTYGYLEDLTTEWRPRSLGQLVTTHGPLNNAQHLENLKQLWYALDGACQKGYIAVDSYEQRGPSLFTTNHYTPKPLPTEDALPSPAKLGVYESARHVNELQAALTPPETMPGRYLRRAQRVSGGSIGSRAVPVILDGPLHIAAARKQLKSLLDEHFSSLLLTLK